MFEGKRPVPAAESMHRMDHGVAQAMRELSWSELTAKLAASRDLRTMIGAQDDASDASFDAGSARWIAEHTGNTGADGKFAVNLEASANGKWDPAIVCRNNSEPLPASRGTE